jgi:hypothetical protein
MCFEKKDGELLRSLSRAFKGSMQGTAIMSCEKAPKRNSESDAGFGAATIA